jgi:hypothetical protein
VETSNPRDYFTTCRSILQHQKDDYALFKRICVASATGHY